MDNLVLCPCGHALDRHADRGCTGVREMECNCSRTAFEALDAAVESARVYYPRRYDQPWPSEP